MKLRIWLPCILLIVIFIILIRNYFTDTEGFQVSLPYTSPPPQNPEKTKDNFWLILSKYGTSGSTGTSGSRSGSGSGPPSISNLVDQVMNPKPKDTFQMVFPKYVSMYALAKYNYDPVTARTVLINEYDVLQTDLQTAVETEQRSRSEFASDPKTQSCTQINNMTMGFYGELIRLYKGAQNLSGVVKNAGSFHDENMSLQNLVLSACKTQNSLPSEDCKKLATMDEKLFPLLPRFDAINVNILADGESIQDMIDTLVQAYMGMGCRRSTSGSAPTDGTPSIDTIFSDTYIDSLGTIDIDFLYEKLQELSPYYVSRNIINYISSKLIGTSEFNAGLSDSLDYLKDMNKITNNIVSLNTDIAPLQRGKFFSESGATAGGFANCPPGYYCTVGSTMPIKCPVGTYCPAGTAGEPIQCPRGLFSPPGSTKLEDCQTTLPVGYYTDTTTGQLIECPTGHYCADGNRTLCPPGTYNMKKGMGSITACLDCPKGSYCKTTTSITPCDPGTYNDKPRQFTSGSSGSGSSSGSSGSSSGSSNGCLPCPQGTSCINKGTVTPMPCPAGTYSATLGLKVPCTPVAQGYYLEGTGNRAESTRKECSAGYYCPGGTGAPVTCPTGSYCPEVLLANATLCPAGSYGSTTGLQSATCTGRCDAGYLCPPGSSSSTAIACPEGYYCPAGTGTATICPTGAYCPRLSPSPTLCPEGTYNEVAGKTQIGDCLPCPPGKECGVGTSNPAPCPLGSYCPGGGETNACVPGYYCDETGLQEPKLCPAGTYKPGGGYAITDCKPCEAGTWSNTPGEINGCRETCPPGSYCPSHNSMSIYTIPTTGFAAYPQPTTQGSQQGSRRTITIPIGPTEPVPCPVGTYCAQSGMGVPTPCPVGTYSTRTGQPDANTCEPCEPGKYCPTAGASSQVVCPIGTFCPSQGGSSPTQCRIGQICPVPGLQAGSACPPGKLCDITGIGIPPPPYKSCPPGTYSTGGAGSSCTRCPPGTIGSGDSTTSACSGQCPAGYYCTDGTTLTSGSSTNPSGSSTNPPKQCPLGHYCPGGNGNLSTPIGPIPCPNGFYSNAVGLSTDQCSGMCPAGYYCNPGTILISGNSTNPPQLCPAGKFCLTRTGGLNSPYPPQNCPGGTSSPAGSAACVPCQSGYSTQSCVPDGTRSCPLNRGALCVPCDENTYSFNPGDNNNPSNNNSSELLDIHVSTFKTYNSPIGIVVDSGGAVYAASFSNHCIQKLSFPNVSTIGGICGTSGTSNIGLGTFNLPRGLAIDSIGNLFVSDSGNHVIRKITPGGIVTTFAGTMGVAGFVNSSSGVLPKFNFPSGITIDSSDNLYVCDTDNHSIRKITTGGIVSTIAGNGTSGSEDNIYANSSISARFNTPLGITVDSLGNMYVTDYNNHTIRKLTPITSNSSSGSVISVRYAVTTIAGSSGNLGTTDGTGSCARFWYPSGIVLDPNGVLYVSSGHTIRKITLTTRGSGSRSASGSGSGSGSGSRSASGSGSGSSACAVSDNSIATVTTLTGSTQGYRDGPGSSSQFNWPYYLSYFNGVLYVGDWSNNVIRKITISVSVKVTTVAGNKTHPTNAAIAARAAEVEAAANAAAAAAAAEKGMPAPAPRAAAPVVNPLITSSADGINTQTYIYRPMGIAIDSFGAIYVSDRNHCIRKIYFQNPNSSGSGVSTSSMVITIGGICGMSGLIDDKPGTFNLPRGLAIDSTGNLFICDSGNHVIRKITPGGNVTTFAGIKGQAGISNEDNTVLLFNFPSGITIDSADNLYIADTSNHCIKKITPGGIVSIIAGSAGSSGSEDNIYASRTPTPRFNYPIGITVDSLGNIYVCENGNHTIRKLTPITTNSSSGSVISVRYAVTTIAGSSGNPGTTDGTGSCARFWYPYSIVVDPNGVLSVTSGHTIRKITLTTRGSGSRSASGSGSGSSTCAVTDNSIATVTTLAGSTQGYTDGPDSSSQFNSPYHLSYFDGALYVADWGNNTIRKITIPVSTQGRLTTPTPTICKPCPIFTTSPPGSRKCIHSIGYITNPTAAGTAFNYHNAVRRGFFINRLARSEIPDYGWYLDDILSRLSSSLPSSVPNIESQPWDTVNTPYTRWNIDPNIRIYTNYVGTSKLYLFPGWIAFGYVYQNVDTTTLGTSDRLRLDTGPYRLLSTVRNRTHALIILRENEITIGANEIPSIISNNTQTPFPQYICIHSGYTLSSLCTQQE